MQEYDLENEADLEGDEKVVHEAKRRWKECMDWESTARERFIDDYKFYNGDTDNKYQWPDSIRAGREINQRPCLTINKTRQHCLHIINDAKQNTPSIKIVATGDEATFESAQVYEGLIRHIEYISNAKVAYDTAVEFQVTGGVGYWRVGTDYISADSFDQDIFIRRIKDPLNVYIDPNTVEKDGSDARYAFIFTDLSKEEFHKQYPKYTDFDGQQALDDTSVFNDEYHIRIAEYFTVVPKKDKLVAITDKSTGFSYIHRKSEIPPHIREMMKNRPIDDLEIKYRDIEGSKVEWYLFVGNKIAERNTWIGETIPIVKVVGEETVIDGQMDRKGHTRALKDAQRIYNYSASSATEVVALQTKSPWIAPALAIEGYETYWASANTDNHAVLPYNNRDDDGNEIAPPQRIQAPLPSPAFAQLMQDADRQMDMATGQYEATFGQPSNEKSGKAINARQRQGETATYHYIDNLAIAIRRTGKIMLEIIPLVYDTPRILQILAEDNTTSQIMLQPQAAQAFEQKKAIHTQEVKRIFNPNVGKYEVIADVAPGYATKRDEAFNALGEIISRSPQSLTLLGDLWAENADFPTSNKIAERMRNMLPPQALGQGVDPQVQELQGQMQKLETLNAKLLQKLSEDQIKMKNYVDQKDINTYKAETDRLKTNADIIAKHILTPKDQAMLTHDLAKQEHASKIQYLQTALEAEIAQQNQQVMQQQGGQNASQDNQ